LKINYTIIWFLKLITITIFISSGTYIVFKIIATGDLYKTIVEAIKYDCLVFLRESY
jgi:hypothetical protein